MTGDSARDPMGPIQPDSRGHMEPEGFALWASVVLTRLEWQSVGHLELLRAKVENVMQTLAEQAAERWGDR